MEFAHIQTLIDNDGHITLGYLYPVGSVAVANDESSVLAMLKRRQGETVMELLTRLDEAVRRSTELDEYADEVNHT